MSILGMDEKEAPTVSPVKKSSAAPTMVAATAKPIIHNRRSRGNALKETMSETKPANDALDIAIIGVSGRYPKARTMIEFWRNLRDGKDCVTEIPEGRWDHSLFFDADKKKQGKTYSKWGASWTVWINLTLYFSISHQERLKSWTRKSACSWNASMKR